MEAVNALFQRSITLPSGAVDPSPRIVLDGTNDVILVYGTGGALVGSFAATAGVDSLGNSYPAGLSIGSAASTHWTFDVIAQKFSMFDVNALLNMVINGQVGNSYLVWMDNFSSTWASFSAAAVQMGPLSVAGALPTSQDQINAALMTFTQGSTPSLSLDSLVNTTGSGSVGMQLQLVSGSTPTGTTPGNINNAKLVPISLAGTAAADIELFKGAVYRGDLTGWQIPTVPANWTRTGFATELGLQYRIDCMDNLFIVGAVKYTGAGLPAGTNTTLFTLPAAYRPIAGTRRPTYQSTGNGVFGWAVVQSGGAVIVSNPTALVTNDVIEFEITCPMGNLP